MNSNGNDLKAYEIVRYSQVPVSRIYGILADLEAKKIIKQTLNIEKLREANRKKIEKLREEAKKYGLKLTTYAPSHRNNLKKVHITKTWKLISFKKYINEKIEELENFRNEVIK